MYDYKSSYIQFFAVLSQYAKLNVTVVTDSTVYQGLVDSTLGEHKLNMVSGPSSNPSVMTITFRDSSDSPGFIQMIDDYTNEDIQSVRIVGYPKLA